MRVDVKKFLFVGAQKQKESFFKTAQKNGLVEFIDVHKNNVFETPDDLKTLHEAHKILLTVLFQPQEELEDMTAIALAKKIVAIAKELEDLYEKKRLLNMEILV